MVSESLPREAYAIAIICALVEEKAAMEIMFDEEHETLEQRSNDPNSYAFGSIGSHNVVIACLPSGHQGKSAATAVALHMVRSFPIKLGLMVGIGGGVPNHKNDIRLGDVVVSMPAARHGGVVQYDLGRMESDGFHIKGHLDKPPKSLLSAVTSLRTKHEKHDPQFPQYLESITSNRRMARKYGYQGRDNDRLFSADAVHPRDQMSCMECEKLLHIVPRPDREDDTPQVFYGTIGSGDMVMKDGLERDRRAAAEGVLCFEMEAAGLMNDFPCLVIRGISDYADSHKNDRWQPCAAASAAAYAKELLSVVKTHEVESLAVAGQHRVEFDYQKLPAGETFLDRSEQMLKLEQFFLGQDPENKRRRAFSVHGPAGTGKTQLCAEFARRYHSHFTAIFWLDASSEDALLWSFVDIALRLPSNEISSKIIREAKENPPEKEGSVSGVHDWLSKSTNSRWLLIIDNADRECGLDGTDPQRFDIWSYCPKVNHGNVLVTSGEPFLIGLDDNLKVPPCDRMKGQAILEAVGGEKILSAEPKIIQGLLDRLEGYPLTLTQAGAYLNRTPASIAEYISEFDKTQEKLLRSQPRYPLQEYSQLALLTTWKLSHDHLAGRHQDTSNLLKLWGFLNGSDIWYDLIARVKWLDEVQQQPQLQPNIQVPQWLRSLASKEFEFDRALKVLAGFSLVQEYRNAGRFAVNSQLHVWCQRLTTSEDERTTFIALAVNIVGGMVPENLSEAWSNQLRLEAHGRQIMHILRTDGWPRDVAKLSILAYYRIAKLFKSLDERNLAIEMYERTLPDVKKVLGSHNDTVLDILLSLGRLYHLEEDYAAAEKMYQQALAISQETLGPGHDETLSTAHNLAHIFGKRGKLKEAVVMYKQGLAAYTRIHGEEHQGVIACINNLAICYDEQGKSDQAARMYRKSIAGSKRIFGDAHPMTLDAMKNLSELYRTQGNIKDSKALNAQIKAANVNYTFDVTGNYEVHSD